MMDDDRTMVVGNALAEMFGPVIDSYTRAEAIEDGVLIDVSEMAREAGITYPVAITHRVWSEYITPDERSRHLGQSESGRLWDVLWMYRAAARKFCGSQMLFRLYFIMKRSQRRLITLKAICSPGDDAEPVITIMLPEED